MQRTIGNKSSLSQTLQEMTEVIYKVSFDSMVAQGCALHRISLRASTTVVDPAVTMCAAAAEERAKSRPRWDLVRADDKNVFEPFSFTGDKRKEVRDTIEKVQLLENEHYETILKDASLSDAIRTL
ncbi:hypothetical protein HD554DRAFT_2178254 [Boletus coccyginus]|nr:hypothetical protein HD554DRAFT_2178254 [Boletus coccyginus]